MEDVPGAGEWRRVGYAGQLLQLRHANDAEAWTWERAVEIEGMDLAWLWAGL